MLFFSTFNNTNLNKLFLFFEKNYLKSELYKPEEWSAFDRLFLDLPLTTNNLESYHCHFKSHFDKSHPTFWKFVEGRKIKQKETEALIKK